MPDTVQQTESRNARSHDVHQHHPQTSARGPSGSVPPRASMLHHSPPTGHARASRTVRIPCKIHDRCSTVVDFGACADRKPILRVARPHPLLRDPIDRHCTRSPARWQASGTKPVPEFALSENADSKLAQCQSNDRLASAADFATFRTTCDERSLSRIGSRISESINRWITRNAISSCSSHIILHLDPTAVGGDSPRCS